MEICLLYILDVNKCNAYNRKRSLCIRCYFDLIFGKRSDVTIYMGPLAPARHHFTLLCIYYKNVKENFIAVSHESDALIYLNTYYYWAKWMNWIQRHVYFSIFCFLFPIIYM
jgi:hypothetical protein